MLAGGRIFMERENKDQKKRKDCQECESVVAEKIENLEKQLEECKEQEGQLKEKLLRSTADFHNYKNRTEQESLLWISKAKEGVLQDFLSIVDDFDRAFAECEKHGIKKEDQIWLDGFKLITKSLYKLLEKYHVTEIQDNKEFNPEVHEAVVQLDSDQHKSGEVVQVLQKGFMFQDKVLRPAKVSVAK